MKDRVVLCALCALFGCRQANNIEINPITLCYSTSEQSKTNILTQGDQIGIFAAVEGTENYFLENAKYVVGSDGRSLSTSPAVYYPEAKQAVAFAAYLPFGGVWDGAVGTFSVPADQSTTLKQADLCWAKASSTPMAAPVALEFAHKMARLLITTNEPTSKIVVPNAFSGGTLDIRTGTFTNTLKSSVSTSGTELILPAQTVTRLVLTVAGVEYVFEGAISLESAKTTSINLTLNPTQKTATLAGSSTTNWFSSATQGDPTQAVSNILTMHWANYLPQGATPDKVTLTINNTDYTVSSGITYADKTFTVPFASSALRYPYTITKIVFPNLPPCTQLLSATIYKSSALTLGIKDPANAVLVNGVWWATGNLIASNSTAGAQGSGGCKIGAPGDGGLYFQFGSLIGYKGGAQSNGGTGVGSNPYTGSGTQWWNGAGSFSWANDAMVWPSTMTKPPTAWSSSYGAAVGDPCTYYLGGTWRLPLTTDFISLCNGQSGGGRFAWSAVGASWVPSPVAGGNFYSNKLFFPASGSRDTSNGSFYNVTRYGNYWSSSVYNATNGYLLLFNQANGVFPQNNYYRSDAFPVRCVSPVS